MTQRTIRRAAMALAIAAALGATLSACVPLVVGGAAAVGMGLVATDRRSSGAQLDDQGIELRGAARIRDIANDNMNVTVISYNRQVLAIGTVGSEADRQRVSDVLRQVDNVRAVFNEVTVGPGSTIQERTNDAFISGKVKASLLDAKDIFANSFKIETERGTVYLMGIATRRETDRATEIARGVSGVRKVVRIVEIVSESELANRLPADSRNAAPASPGGVEARPLPPAPAPSGGGAVVTPIR
ncbi:MAG: BON domain-containing protein [Gammaproteobacteria bacterium]|nr:BON domain-containing protein [Gammaproteobacteria bacterium]MBU1441329.1 BON domain-containing protein [Gammaproteobacteria bacterium]MBU2284859.1 BON domain-containing protein [Gammaproteobacteria bacterium]